MGNLTIKQYAESRNKSVQAVYKQMKAVNTIPELEGHIKFLKIGNKKTKVLDEHAQAVLDQASQQAPTVVVDNAKDDEIAFLKAQVNELQTKLFDVQQRYIESQESSNKRILELSEKLLLLEQKSESKRHWWQFKK